jgi:hypothetical protein
LLTHIELLLVETAHDIRIAEAFSAARDADLADRLDSLDRWLTAIEERG